MSQTYLLMILLAIGLLFVQANFDLALPVRLTMINMVNRYKRAKRK
jgi:hypothetical protein